jgi:ParB-like chromosome segregation protein Spo0J
MIKKVKIAEVKPNPNNPRLIKDDKFRKLVKSIQEFPDMLNVRPIVVNQDMVVLGGNMRLKAIKEAGHTEIAVEIVDWNEQQQKEFIIKDNASFGEWDWDDLANNWDAQELTEWGLDIPNFNIEGFTDKNKELSLDDVTDLMTITLKYTEDEYHIVKDALLKLAATPEQAIWKLLGND